MKKNHFWQSALFASALLFGFSACSSDDNGAPQQNTNQERTLTIALNLGQSTPTTMRSTTITSDPTGEATINSVIVAIFSGDTPVKIEEVTSTSGTITGTSINKWDNSGQKITVAAQGVTANDSVFVVVNPGATSKATLLAAANKSAFETTALGIDEALESTTAGEEKETGFTMLGKAALSSGSGDVTYTASLNVYRMVSKVSLESVTSDFTGTIYDGYTFTITEIYMDNVPSAHPYNFIKNKDNSYDYCTGRTGATSPEVVKDYLSTGTVSHATSTTTIANKYYFYTMPNAEDAKAKATRLVLKGTFVKGTTSATVYYPIYLNYDNANQTYASNADTPYEGHVFAREAKKIYANDWYKVSAVIKSIGTTDPDQDLDPQAVQVQITVAAWNPITQTATFQ